MSAPAIKQNVDNWSALFSSHLETVKRRSAAALAAAGYDALLLHSGTPPLIFLDDHHLPFRAQAPFKVWAPLSDAPDSFVLFVPGKKPLLLIHQPVDYWHKSPSTTAGVLDAVRSTSSAARRARPLAPPCRTISRAPPSSAHRSRSCCPGDPRQSIPSTSWHSSTTPAPQRRRTKWRRCARPMCSALAVTWPPNAPFAPAPASSRLRWNS